MFCVCQGFFLDLKIEDIAVKRSEVARFSRVRDVVRTTNGRCHRKTPQKKHLFGVSGMWRFRCKALPKKNVFCVRGTFFGRQDCRSRLKTPQEKHVFCVSGAFFGFKKSQISL